MMKLLQVVLPQFSSLLAYREKQMSQGLPVDLLIERLVLWQELTEVNAFHTEECDQHDINFLTLTVLLSIASATSNSSTQTSTSHHQ